MDCLETNSLSALFYSSPHSILCSCILDCVVYFHCFTWAVYNSKYKYAILMVYLYWLFLSITYTDYEIVTWKHGISLDKLIWASANSNCTKSVGFILLFFKLYVIICITQVICLHTTTYRWFAVLNYVNLFYVCWLIVCAINVIDWLIDYCTYNQHA